jgi:hypothetical protein
VNENAKGKYWHSVEFYHVGKEFEKKKENVGDGH